jgi:hypothetical protein
VPPLSDTSLNALVGTARHVTAPVAWRTGARPALQAILGDKTITMTMPCSRLMTEQARRHRAVASTGRASVSAKDFSDVAAGCHARGPVVELNPAPG